MDKIKYNGRAMILLSPIFRKHAAQGFGARGDIESNQDTDTAATGNLTLERDLNPYETFLKNLDKMLETNPEYALTMLQNAITGRRFPEQETNLKTAFNDLKLELQNQKPQPQPQLQTVFNPSPSLG